MDRGKTRSRGLIALTLLATLVGSVAGYQFLMPDVPPTETVLRYAVNREASANDALLLTPLYPTTTAPAHVFKGNFWASPQIVQLPGQRPFLLVLPSSGSVAALDLQSGRLKWEVKLPHAKTQEAELRAAPLQVNGQLVVAYTTRDRIEGATTHRAAVIDLRRGVLNRSFANLVFTAETPAADARGTVVFDPEWHLPRSIAHIPSGGGFGHAYVSFGGNQDQGAWHGWLFELDLDVWRRGLPGRAILSAFVTTPEADCDDGTEGKLCGGGIWAYAGPDFHRSPTGYEILVQTGNGRLDLERGNYAQSLSAVRPRAQNSTPHVTGDSARADPREPSNECLATCRNLFVPRLLPTDTPLRPANGSCDGKPFMECLNINDWDFGSSSPVRVEAGGRAFYVTAGKAGDVYLLDAVRLGVLYDRRQAVDALRYAGGTLRPAEPGLDDDAARGGRHRWLACHGDSNLQSRQGSCRRRNSVSHQDRRRWPETGRGMACPQSGCAGGN